MRGKTRQAAFTTMMVCLCALLQITFISKHALSENCKNKNVARKFWQMRPCASEGKCFILEDKRFCRSFALALPWELQTQSAVGPLSAEQSEAWVFVPLPHDASQTYLRSFPLLQRFPLILSDPWTPSPPSSPPWLPWAPVFRLLSFDWAGPSAAPFVGTSSVTCHSSLVCTASEWASREDRNSNHFHIYSEAYLPTFLNNDNICKTMCSVVCRCFKKRQ